MRYGILGTTTAHTDDGRSAALGGPRLRALLAALALYPGRARTAEALIDAVWDGEPPADAAGALQALVARLRRALGPDAVDSTAGGYRLCAGPDDVDLHRFQRLADEGAAALAAGEPERAETLLGEALALWRGPVLADLPGRSALAGRYEARHLDARRTRLAAAVALGRADRALPELTELCADHPLDEPLHALLLRALRAAGRPAEALAAYETVRAGIAERLGADPGPELRALHAELLAYAAPEAPAVTTPAPAPRGNLRARLTSFVGREDDLDLIRTDLGRHRLVTLLGPGGAGKTRLSQEAAETAAAGNGDWPDGVWFAELAPLDDPATVPEAVLTALGARETVVRTAAAESMREAVGLDPLDRLAEHCAARRMLLVLDNCEHVVDAAARLAETLLAHCPHVTVLATSREPLAVPGELVRPVEPLPDPVALRLFADRGAAARPGFRVEDDLAACAEICRRLDGLPLAIELAAARLRMLTPRGLADRLDDRFRLLTSGSRTVLPRQQTLRAVVDWSWDLLDEAERAVLRRLSVFAGGCGLAMAEEVCAGDGVAVRDVAVLLGSLVDKSLVVAAPADGGEMRYRLLETVGEYAAERLDEAGERAAVERRHLVAYRELARVTDPLLRGPRQRASLDLLELEHDNLRTALRRAVAAGEEQEGLCLVLSLTWFWSLRDHRGDARHWSEAVAALGPDPFAEPVEPAPPIFVSCIDAPPPMTPELLAEARRGVRLIGIASIENSMRVIGSPEMQERLRGVGKAYGDGQPQNCRVPGFLWFYAIVLSADFEAMNTAVERSVEMCREHGFEWGLANALQLRAKVLNDRTGGLAQATRDADESLEIFRRLGDAWGVAEALSGRGEAHERRAEFALAAEDYREAIGLAHEIGATSELPALRARLAEALLESGAMELAEGERMLRQSIADADKGNPETSAFARVMLASRIARVGRTAEARELFDDLMGEFSKASFAVFESMMNGQLGWLDILEGKSEEALPRLRTALALTDDPLAQLVVPQMATVQLLYASLAHAELGGEEGALRAARLLGAVEALRPGDYPMVSAEVEIREQATAKARAALGDAAFDHAYAEGGTLTKEEAAALV
ncbi:AfsR family transcriptional regulator [Streptomyces griseocarneus]|nr:AfsR family transcriptional regulator [Streptomyces griseocarneus]